MDVAPTGDAWRSLDHLEVEFPPLIHISAPEFADLRTPPFKGPDRYRMLRQ